MLRGGPRDAARVFAGPSTRPVYAPRAPPTAPNRPRPSPASHQNTMSSENGRPRTVRRRVVAAVLGTVVALAAGEVVVRVARPSYAPRRADYGIAPLPGPPPTWVYRPGSTVAFTWDGDPLGVLPPGARMETRVNALGLRGSLPAPGARSAVVLGDSFTFGEGVAEAETFVGRLDAAWRGRGTRFVNAGVAGHGTVEEAARLVGLLDRLRPAAVLLVHVPNDAIPWDHSAERGTDLLNVAAPSGSRLLGLLRSVASTGDVEQWYLSYYRGERAEHWERARDALLWMAGTCAARNVRCGVVTFPLLHRLDDYPLAEITSLVEAAARDAHVPFLDLTPSFAGRDAPALWAHPADRHPNARAHAIAAEAMGPFVEGLLR